MKLTKDELLARMVDGQIVINDDVDLDELPWNGYGEKIMALVIGGNCDIHGNCNIGGFCVIGGYCVIRGNCYIGGNLYWSHASKPKAKFIKCKRVLPPDWQRDYWGERLGISMDGCYGDIIKRILPVLDDWLTLDKWTPTERWMLESLRPGRD